MTEDDAVQAMASAIAKARVHAPSADDATHWDQYSMTAMVGLHHARAAMEGLKHAGYQLLKTGRSRLKTGL